MEDKDFDSMVEEFEQNPRIIPLPPSKLDQEAVETGHKKTAQLMSEFEEQLKKLEKLLKKDPEKCRLELFNLDYLMAQLPKSIITKQMQERVKKLEDSLEEDDKQAKAKHLEKKQKKDLGDLKEIEEDLNLEGFEEWAEDVGLAGEENKTKKEQKKIPGKEKTEKKIRKQEEPKKENCLAESKANEEKFLAEIEEDENKQVEEDNFFESQLKPPKFQKKEEEYNAEDLAELQKLEKEEREEAKKEERTDSIDSIQKSMEKIPEKKEKQQKNVISPGSVGQQPKQEFERKYKPTINHEEMHPAPTIPKKIPEKPIYHNHLKIKPSLESDKLGFIEGYSIGEGTSSTELYDKGIEFFHRKDYKKAMQCFTAVLKIAPNNIAARIRMQEIKDEIKQKGG